MSGLFISFEGIDGCGKSTQADLLRSYLESKGEQVELLREPGGTALSEQIREILLNPNNEKMDPSTESILLSASRAQLTREIIIPALERGNVVICDRYADSTLAYQGYGRGINLEWLEKLNAFATAGLKPDITLLVDLPVDEAFNRMQSKSFDRIEMEGIEFLDKVRSGYLELTDRFSKRYFMIDGMETIEEMSKKIINKIEEIRT
ncbi:MAG TPA: dTMP kinase [Candidatus Marinimicrobia bacterium]|nr:dTMP kinase [Candidatus Neomarinimicrobiota bacterium]